MFTDVLFVVTCTIWLIQGVRMSRFITRMNRDMRPDPTAPAATRQWTEDDL